MKAWTDADGREFTLIYGEDAEQPNGGYWAPDGITYRECYRCGINMRLEEERERELRTWCADCDYPEFRAPFESGSAARFLTLVAA